MIELNSPEGAERLRLLADASEAPEAFRVRVARLLDALARRGLELPSIEDLELLAPLVACGEATAARLRRSPRLLPWLLRTAFLDEERPARSFERQVLARVQQLDDEDFEGLQRVLRRYRHREMLRIGLRDLTRRAPLRIVVRELSHLADALLLAALSFCDRRLARRFGQPLGDAFCVVALGKLGGQELNYSSDVDVVFAYDRDGPTPSGHSRREQAVKLAELVIRALSEVTADGVAFRVDANLRPEGRAGSLAQSIGEMERYYERAGQTWERAALIKARPSAGGLDVGWELLQRLRPFVYRRSMDLAAVEAIAAMKARIDRAHGRAAADDVKLGPGGIREIEFFVQALQLLHGGRHPPVRVRGTLDALEALVFSGLLSARDRDLFADAYVFLRDVEHRVQLPSDRQTHALPPADDRAARRALARRMGLPTAEELERQLDRHRSAVHARFSALFATATEEHPVPPGVELALDHEAEPARRETALGELGFFRPDLARENLDRLARHEEGAFGARGRERHPGLAERLLQEMSGAPDPDQALQRFAQLPTSLWAPGTVNALFASSFATARLLILLFGSTESIARDFQQHPELLDALVRRDAAALERDRAQMAREVRERLARVADLEDKLALLRRVRHEESLRVCLHDLAGRLDHVSVGRQLTACAEALLEEALALARADVSARFGEPPQARVAVFGLGSLGGAELDYESDLDLLFVHDAQGQTLQPETGGAHRLTGAEWATKVAQRLLSHLTVTLTEGVLYRVDARLRPSGSQGPLVASLRSLADYHGITNPERRGRAALWERQALLRARFVAGDASLGEEASRTVLQPAVFGRPLPPDAAEQIAQMRRRLEPAPSPEHIEVKKGPGGLLDVEFAVQYLQLRHAVPSPSTRSALTLLTDAGVLTAELASELRGAFDFLRRLESRLRLIHGRSEVFVPVRGRALEQLARQFGDVGPGAGERLVRRLQRTQERTRRLFDRLVLHVEG